MSKRPGLVRWLRYAYGGSLPEQFDEWVFRDVTGRTWVWRHLARALVQLAPAIVAVAVLLPGAPWIRLVAIGAATPMGLLFCLAYMVETTDRRLVKAGYPSGTAEAVRVERSSAADATARARRREKATARRARRLQRAA